MVYSVVSNRSSFSMASTYRLVREAHVVVTKDGGKPDILTIPEGSILTVHEPLPVTGLVPVKWEALTVKMFAEDLGHRAEPLD